MYKLQINTNLSCTPAFLWTSGTNEGFVLFLLLLYELEEIPFPLFPFPFCGTVRRYRPHSPHISAAKIAFGPYNAQRGTYQSPENLNAIVLFSVHNADYDTLAAAHHVRLKRARRWETGKAEHKLAFGQAGMGEGGGTISAEGGQYPLADYVRGDKICGGTKSAPTRVVEAHQNRSIHS